MSTDIVKGLVNSNIHGWLDCGEMGTSVIVGGLANGVMFHKASTILENTTQGAVSPVHPGLFILEIHLQTQHGTSIPELGHCPAD